MRSDFSLYNQALFMYGPKAILSYSVTILLTMYYIVCLVLLGGSVYDKYKYHVEALQL